jgi:hypothetical protein
VLAVAQYICDEGFLREGRLVMVTSRPDAIELDLGIAQWFLHYFNGMSRNYIQEHERYFRREDLLVL